MTTKTTTTPMPSEAVRPQEVPAGRYALVNRSGATAFYRVEVPTQGKWKGFRFVRVQAGGEFYPLSRAAEGEILRSIAAAPLDAMVRYGREVGACGRCGRELTDETSRALGIGPVCLGKS